MLAPISLVSAVLSGGSSYDGGGGAGRARGLTVTHIGGARELVALIRRGEIDAVRRASPSWMRFMILAEISLCRTWSCQE